jgi:hypothetical protein
MSATTRPTPPVTSGHVDLRWRAWIHSSTSPVSAKNRHAATLVQVVEVREPAAVGGFGFRHERGSVDRDPGIAARAGRREIQLLVRPLGGRVAEIDVELLLEPGLQRRRQGCLHVGAREQSPLGQPERRFAGRHHGRGAESRGVIERDARHREQDQRGKTNRGADPVPEVHGAVHLHASPRIHPIFLPAMKKSRRNRARNLHEKNSYLQGHSIDRGPGGHAKGQMSVGTHVMSADRARRTDPGTGKPPAAVGAARHAQVERTTV